MSNKIWQLMPKVDQTLIEEYPEYSSITLQLLNNRGLISKEEIKEFLEGSYEESMHDPFLFQDMEAAVSLIIKHVKEQNKIVVYGDYDADGVTSAALMAEILEKFRAQVDVYLPDRVSEGYGLNMEAVEQIASEGVKLIVTVDGGIRNKAEVARAKEFGLDVVITDHHVAPEKKEDLPDCSIINTQVKEETYPFKALAGVGAAFKTAKALIEKSKLEAEHKQILEERLLDLVAIGTVADMVNLRGENRILVKKGLSVLNKTKRVGLQELIKVVNVNHGRVLNSWNIGFQLAPRLNAAGRMKHANTAYELLAAKTEKQARDLAQGLNENNIERQNITTDIVARVEEQIKKEDKIIIGICGEADEKWNEGVIGLVAGKIANKYYRPTLVITKTEDGYKGSGRGIPEFNIVEAIEETSEFLEKYGGHPMACGFSLAAENLDDFIKKLKQIATTKLKGVDLTPKIKIEAELQPEEISEALIKEIEVFEPFGKDNDRPVFVTRGMQIIDIMLMGLEEKHIKLRLKSDNSRTLSALGFSQAERWQNLTIGDKIDIAYYLEVNEFNGKREVQMRIVDIKTHNV